MSGRRGSTLVESSVVLMLFLVILIGVLDAGQILFFHQFLTERVTGWGEPAGPRPGHRWRWLPLFGLPDPHPDVCGR